ncbi:Starch synthase, chloroplastic/amyloplastic [Quillaja saponaria]|uniref:starch synthase n=1 Tax=Quillaja saponaria TaxID=32244 RepID=A0AAD7L889_QUISA|nr:Starch synthase, chloroplastic/amyloplastic [Quillaja saponaria]
METLLNAASSIPSHRLVPKPRVLPPKPVTARPLCCLRNNGDVNGLRKAQSQQGFEDQPKGEISQSSSGDHKAKQSDIWEFFREAQQNILYLNKQRLLAVEELSKSNREKQLLLNKIKKLEAEKQAGAGKDKLSVCWEMLLRIDSMVLSGIVSPEEASGLRSMVMDQKVNVADFFIDTTQRRDAELLGELHAFSERSKKNGFHVVHICTEMAPLVSVGSLASYVTGLSQAVQRKGHLVEVILPKYMSLDLDDVQGLREVESEFYSYFNGQIHGNRIWMGVIYGIGVTLIEPLYYSSFFNREKIYGYSDDFERFSYFARASLDYIVKCGKQPDVLHLHNWETAIVGPLFWDIFVKQCLEQPDKLALCGLDPARLHRPDRLQDNNKTHLVNILKGGVVYSNKVVISSIHSKHRIIHSPSHGLEPSLNIHKDKLVVAPCGFDKLTWDPSKDYFLPENYSAENMKGKAVSKVALQQHVGLSEHDSITLVGCISSEMTDGHIEQLKESIRDATQRNVQFVFMGSSKKPSLNRALESFQEELVDGGLRFITRYEEALSHLLFAGSDIILCRSFHDPIFHVPLKALRYGAAPILVNSNDRNFADHDYEATMYSQYISSTFANVSLSLALHEIKSNPSKWIRRIQDAMTQDFSWDGECSDIYVSAYTAIKSL